MAQSIYDLLGQDTRQLTTAAPQDTTGQLEKVLGATSGKEVAPAGPKRSALGEKIALQETKTKLDTIAGQSANVQAAQETASQGITQQHDIQMKQLDQRVLAQRFQYQAETTRLLNEASRGETKLAFLKDNSKREQLGHTLRMADDKYIFNLQLNGDKARLNNDLAFRENLQKDIFAGYEDLAREDAFFREALAANADSAQEKLGQMTIQNALDINDAEVDAAKKGAVWKALGGGLGGVLGGLGGMRSAPPQTQTAPSQAPASEQPGSYTRGFNEPTPLATGPVRQQ